jgi:RHS repeat-associated protein
VGNRKIKTEIVNGNTTTTSSEYDASDRLLNEKVNQQVVVSYSHDNQGSTLTKTENGVTTEYTWDYENRLIAAKVRDAGGATQQQMQYRYNDNGIRVVSTVDGVETRYLIDANRPYAQVLEEYSANGAVQVSYVYGNRLISEKQGGGRTFYHVDGLGSTRSLSDTTGNVVSTYNYEAFGELLNSTGGVSNKYLFAGEQYDSNLGDYYLRQRYYDTQAGRFSRSDTYEGRLGEPLTLHKYIYTHDNPVNGTDPSGLFTSQEISAVTSILSTLAAAALAGIPGGSTPIGSVIELSPKQRQSMVESNYTEYIPLVREDQQRGCFSAEVRRRGSKITDDFEPNEVVYATQVSGSNMDFFVITPDGVAATFDGRTPGTRNVWEAKYGYEIMLKVPFLAEANFKKFEKERTRQLIVASGCQYNLQWAFSNEGVANLARDRWANIPPVLHIPFV